VAGLTPDPMRELMRSPDFLAAVHGGLLLRGSSGWKEEEGPTDKGKGGEVRGTKSTGRQREGAF